MSYVTMKNNEPKNKTTMHCFKLFFIYFTLKNKNI